VEKQKEEELSKLRAAEEKRRMQEVSLSLSLFLPRSPLSPISLLNFARAAKYYTFLFVCVRACVRRVCVCVVCVCVCVFVFVCVRE
jgi:hypothetical protein